MELVVNESLLRILNHFLEFAFRDRLQVRRINIEGFQDIGFFRGTSLLERLVNKEDHTLFVSRQTNLCPLLGSDHDSLRLLLVFRGLLGGR